MIQREKYDACLPTLTLVAEYLQQAACLLDTISRLCWLRCVATARGDDDVNVNVGESDYCVDGDHDDEVDGRQNHQ